jgi:cytochrome oxidase Cu insertion factor (SCO1/SenC/PrrC family)
MKMRSYLRFAAVLLCGLLFSQWAVAQQEAAAKPVQQDPEEKARNYFTDLPVLDQNGNSLRFYSDVVKGRVVLINFIFTNCQNTCPMMTRMLQEVRANLSDTVSDEVWFISVSIDPERDTPEALKSFIQENNVDESRWLFLTGEKKNIDHIVKRLGQYNEEVEAHSTLIIAGNASKHKWKKIPPMTPPPGIAQQVQLLAKGFME